MEVAINRSIKENNKPKIKKHRKKNTKKKITKNQNKTNHKKLIETKHTHTKKQTKMQKSRRNNKQGKALVKILNVVGGIAMYFDTQRNCFKFLFKLAIANCSILLLHL